MKRIAYLTLSFLAAASLSASAEETKPVNKVCPFSGEEIDAKQVVAYTKVVGVCCKNCKGKLEKDVAGNLAKIASVKALHVNAKCPFSGEDVDPEVTAAFQGAKVAFCCNQCQSKFDPEKHAAKVVLDQAGNDKCVFTGEDVEARAVVSIKVGFCCGKCVKKFSAAPDKAIAKVKFAKAE